MRDFLIVGYGKLGKFYDNALCARFLVDIVPNNRRKVFYSHIDEFLFYRPYAELAIVSTLSDTHFEITKKLLEANYNVLVEKPITLASIQAKELVDIAREKKLLLFQSTLERRNPLITFLKENVRRDEIERVVSVRQGPAPQRGYVELPVFDLGIHDLDLSFYLYQNKVPWEINVAHCNKSMRRIFVYLKRGVLELDLIEKQIIFKERTHDLSKSSTNNQMLLMVQEIMYRGYEATEDWDVEISMLEELSQKKSYKNFTLKEEAW